MNSRSILLMLLLALPLACGAQFSNRLDAVQWVQQGAKESECKSEAHTEEHVEQRCLPGANRRDVTH